MERRFYLGVVILAVLLLLGIFCGQWMENASRELLQSLAQAEDALRQGNPENALTLVKSARQLWKNSWHRLAMVTDHTVMDEIDGLFAQLEHFAGHSASLLGAGCARVRELISAISDDHRFTWWNLL